MGAPLSYDQITAAFRWAGITYREYSGSRDRCRCHNGSHAAGGPLIRAWGPIVGTLVHITAGDLGSRTVEKYIQDIINGDPNIPCKVQFVVAPDGVVWINSVGRSNHDGSMSTRAYNALRDGTFSLTGYQDLRGTELTGNSFTYGIENINSGPPNAAQRNASVRICAAISHAMGWSGRDCAGHGEVGSDRSYADPGMDMGAFRRDVMSFVSNPTGGSTPPPVIKEDDLPTPNDLLNAPVQRSGFAGDAGTTSLGACVSWLDANFDGIRRLISLVDEASRDQFITVLRSKEFNQDALVDRLVTSIVAALPKDSSADVASVKEAFRQVLQEELTVTGDVKVGQKDAAPTLPQEQAARSMALTSAQPAPDYVLSQEAPVADAAVGAGHPPEPEAGDIEQPPSKKEKKTVS